MGHFDSFFDNEIEKSYLSESISKRRGWPGCGYLTISKQIGTFLFLSTKNNLFCRLPLERRPWYPISHRENQSPQAASAQTACTPNILSMPSSRYRHEYRNVVSESQSKPHLSGTTNLEKKSLNRTCENTPAGSIKLSFYFLFELQRVSLCTAHD
jgi:hypothetical protein